MAPGVEKPMVRIIRDLGSVHSAKRCAAVSSPLPHEQVGDAMLDTRCRGHRAGKGRCVIRSFPYELGIIPRLPLSLTICKAKGASVCKWLCDFVYAHGLAGPTEIFPLTSCRRIE